MLPIVSILYFYLFWFQLCVCEQARIGHQEIRDFSRWAAAVGGLLPSVGRWLCHRWAVDFHSAAAPVPQPKKTPLRVSGSNSPLPPARTQVRFRPEVQKMYLKKKENNNNNLPFIASIHDPPITSMVGRAPHFEKRCPKPLTPMGEVNIKQRLWLILSTKTIIGTILYIFQTFAH